ncbi:hypothetical protein [Sorangium sp. So ce1078]|uniref:hypothetical protein n=1 Tax=Sorangium sp. So ce1078 TaxID=3133329 RepID=UPI003F5F0CF4
MCSAATVAGAPAVVNPCEHVYKVVVAGMISRFRRSGWNRSTLALPSRQAEPRLCRHLRSRAEELISALPPEAPAAFRRVFHRWTGRSPRDYRTEQRRAV